MPRFSSARTGRLARSVTAGLLVLTVVALTGCGDANPASDADPSSTGNADVVIADMQYTPQTIEIATGDTVVWHFDDGSIAHDVVGDGWGSDLQRSETYSHTFDEPGTYPYQCTPHPGMTGEVIVTD